ncbi:hypothetical protein TNCV_682061 [Trichonephila clavipes]|nr:hypothetical protein TNCV_682061 [Trichonephila clavipes]
MRRVNTLGGQKNPVPFLSTSNYGGSPKRLAFKYYSRTEFQSGRCFSFRSMSTSLWLPPAKSSAPCARSEPWIHFRENFTKQKWKKVKSKAVEHTREAEAPDEKRSRLQADQVHHSLARAAETPE